nr:MAG TPA: hypothetical protein [Bacteriophage sp.]
MIFSIKGLAFCLFVQKFTYGAYLTSLKKIAHHHL